MIKTIRLENYRCFDKHEVEFNDLSVVVGKNNAGKSTLLEAIRLVALVTNRYKNLAYKNPPTWTNLPQRYHGVSPSLKGIEMSFKSICHQYSSTPAKVTAYFQDKTKIELFIESSGEIYAAIFNNRGHIIKDKGQSRKLSLPTLNILPQVGPLKENEDLLSEEYVRANIYSSLSSSHFRNQLQYIDGYRSKFNRLIMETWHGLKIIEFQKGNRFSKEQPSLLVRDGNFTAEVGWMGHGVQIWLQTIWFISRCSNDSTIILDEPDVYLHADMQRKLIRFLRDRFKQTIIATHSIEIISEVEPENIIDIDKNKKKSKPLTSYLEIQESINNLGSIQNLELIRCWSSGKFLILEGNYEDFRILKIIQNKMFPESNEPFDLIPRAPTTGWGGWQKALGINMAVKRMGITKLYCIFDSDYHTEEEKEKRRREAKEHNINLYIWNKKEIENYLIVPNAILRFIEKEHTIGSPTLQELKDIITKLTDEMKDKVIDNISSNIRDLNKSFTVGTCNKKARDIVSSNWSDTHKRLSIIPGKDMISFLSNWSKNKFGVSLNKFKIAKELRSEEIDIELRIVVSAIENRDDL